jgi:glycosyltransferase involved in cell wall biosynthesis
VLVGDTGDVFHTHIPALRAKVDELGLGESVLFTGFVPDPDLVLLYNRALALVHPSLMEGFGLPPVEALACGTPVASSTAGSLPEVLGTAALYFDPLDVEAIRRVLESLVQDPKLRAEMSVRARERAAHLSPAETGRALLEVFEELMPAASSRRRSA